MNAIWIWVFEAVFLFGVMLVAALLTQPLRRGQPAVGEEAGPVSLKWLAGRLSWPAAVILLTWVSARLLAAYAPCGAWISGHGAHEQAWVYFWGIVLAYFLIEGLAMLLFSMRGQPFPVPGLLRRILRFIVVMAAIFVVLRYILQIDISSLLASTALLTAVVGFALQGVLGNLLAGMSLHITRSVVPGDWIAVEQFEGEVIDANWRETRLRSVAGHIAMVPNSVLASTIVRHMTRPTTLRRHRIPVGASYSDAPGEVIAALVESALAVPEVLRDPTPSAFITEYKDFGINYDLRFWTNRYYDRTAVEGDVARMIWYKFKRRGIEIPFPMSDKLLNDFMEVVYTQRRLEPEAQEQAGLVTNLLRSDFGTKLFLGPDGQCLLSAEELGQIAPLIRRVQYTRGETLFRQGDPGACLYVLIRGALRGVIEYEGGKHAHEFELGEGAVFGEMSLMTSLPRTATITVAAESELIEVPAEAFTRLLALRPEIPKVLAGLIAERAEKNKSAYANLKAVNTSALAETLGRENILRRFLRLLGRG